MNRAQQFRQTYFTNRVIAAVLLLTVYSMGSVDPAVGFEAVLAGKFIGSLGIVLAVKAVHVHVKQWRTGPSGAGDS